MRKILLLFIYIISMPGILYSQYNVTFETNRNLVHIDTSQHPNIWQIGRPQKPYLDSAYSRPYAIITDTINPYPVNNTSSFTIGLKSYGSLSAYLNFYTRYDMNPLDTGFVEVSIDTGRTWQLVKSYTAVSTGWDYFNNYIIEPCNCAGGPCYDTTIIRFTFKSDTVKSVRDGWMIDNITYGNSICEGVHEYNAGIYNVSISPNPNHGLFTMQLSGAGNQKPEVEIYNMLGEKIYSALTPALSQIGEGVKIDISNQPAGVYLYRVITIEGKQVATGKFIISD